jgi:hypothetical protein
MSGDLRGNVIRWRTISMAQSLIVQLQRPRTVSKLGTQAGEAIALQTQFQTSF